MTVHRAAARLKLCVAFVLSLARCWSGRNLARGKAGRHMLAASGWWWWCLGEGGGGGGGLDGVMHSCSMLCCVVSIPLLLGGIRAEMIGGWDGRSAGGGDGGRSDSDWTFATM